MSNIYIGGPCPQCKKYLAMEASWDDGHEIFCLVCGFCYDVRFELGEEALKENRFLPYYDRKEDKGCQPCKIISEEMKGFGASLITYRDKRITHSFYPVWINQELIDMFMQEVSSPEIDPTQCYLTRWNDETKDVEFIFGREELVEALLPENNRWNDELEDDFEQAVPLRDETVVDVRWDDKTGEVELVFGQEEPWSGKFAASIPPNDEYRDIEFDSEQEHLGDESVVDYRWNSETQEVEFIYKQEELLPAEILTDDILDKTDEKS